jgi:hypothetical protein
MTFAEKHRFTSTLIPNSAPVCAKQEACELDLRSRRGGCIITAECGSCDFEYISSQTRQSKTGRRHASSSPKVVNTECHGSIPDGLDLGAVAVAVNAVLYHPEVSQHLLSATPEV